MLSFLRNNSVKIVYGIVISFVVTTFMGVVFFNESFQASKDIKQRQLDRQAAVATIGDIPVSQQVYLLEYRRLQASIPKDVKVNNNLLEIIQLNSLNNAIQNTLLLEIGKGQKVKATRAEVNASLYSVMDQFEVSSKKELKVAIREAGGSYESMLYQLKNDIIASKIQQSILRSVEITDLDIKNLAFKYNVKEMFVSKRTTDNVLIEEEALYKKAMDMRAKISDSTSFDHELRQIQSEYGVSKNIGTNWIRINEVLPDLARAIYSMNIKEISQPIRTLNGYYIIELKDKEALSVTQQVSEGPLKQAWEREVLYAFLYDIQEGREIKILDPNLKALKLKNEGRFDEAIEAYQGAISQDPSNPYPNVLIAQLYLMKGDVSNAKQSLLKAEIKESLISDQVVLPEIHVLLAEIYKEEGFASKREQQLDKLLNDKGSNLDVLTYLKQVFEGSKDDKRLALVNELIKEKTSTKDVIQDVSNLSKEADDNFLKELESN